MFLSYIHRLLELLYIYIYIYIFIYLFIYLFIRVYIYLLFIQKGYFIARGVLLSLGFGTRFPTRVFSPFHACLVPLNKLLVFFFFRLICRAVSFPPRLCFFHAHSFPLSKPASRPALTATGISKRRTMTTATKKTVMCDLT